MSLSARIPMDGFRFQYLTEMQRQNPKLYRRLRDANHLDQAMAIAGRQANKLFEDLTKDAPKQENGIVEQPYRREAEERVRAMMFEFPDDLQMNEQDEKKAMFSGEPLT